jgi:hypothetical protein
LSDQEIRNCIYRGEYNDLLCGLANVEQFRRLLGISGEASRMQDVGLVLRFMAFNGVSYLNYKEKMRSFLNYRMRDRQNISDILTAKYRENFLNACDLYFTVFGDRTFRRYSEGTKGNPAGRWERSLNKAVFDCLMVWFARYEKRQIIEKKDAIREKFIELCVDDREFQDSIKLSTADQARVVTRFRKWGEALEAIVDAPTSSRRQFSYAMKESLFATDDSCNECHQRIEHIDDAEVDHAIPFSLGGETDLGNARLTHRYCNRAKGNRV